MACRETESSKILLYFGLFVVASSFCRCTKLTRPNISVKLRENSTQSQSQGSDLLYGRLLIGQNPLRHAKLKGTKTTKNFMDADSGYQADMGWGVSMQPKGQGDGSSKMDNPVVERLLKMEPNVECTGDSMTLKVQDAASTSGSLFFVDRGSHLSPLHLSMLPISCGYTIRSTRRDLVLVAPYNGCFVTLEEDSYVLPLRWCGLPVRMSCPLMRHTSPIPPMVTCHAEGMVVKMQWTTSVDKIKINLNGIWEPLMRESPRCGFSVVVHPEGVVFSVRYVPCVEKKDGMYTIELAGDGETNISCPSLSAAQPEPTKSPIKANPSPITKKNGHQPQQTIPSTKPYPFYPYPFYPVLGPENQPALEPPKPPQPEAPQGHVHQQLYPYPLYPVPQPATIPTAAPEPPKPQQPEAPQGQVHQQFYPYPLYPEPQPENQPAKPAAALEPLKPPQPDAPQGQVHQQLYPYPLYPVLQPEKQPATIPTAAPEPPKPQQPEAPRGQVHQQFFPYPLYPVPQPEKRPTIPTAAPEPPKPPQPEAPQGQVHQQFYPYPLYPEPQPEKRPTIPTAAPEPPKPPQPEAPQGQVHEQFFPYPLYPEPQPEKQPAKPAAALEPPIPQQPEAPQGQVHEQFYPYPLYPVPQPEKQPAAIPTAAPEPPKPPQPEAPQGQVHEQFYPYPLYPEPQPEKRPIPTAAPEPPKPPQPEAPQGQVHEQFYPYPLYPVPQPEKQPAAIPTAAPEPPIPPQPEAPQGHVHQQLYPYPLYPVPQPEKPATISTAAPEPLIPPQPEAPQGQVHQQFYPYPLYPVPGPGNQPAAMPTSESPATEIPMGQVHQLVILPPSSSTQQRQWVTPASDPKSQSTVQQPSNVGIVPQGLQQGTQNMPSVYCPQFCPTGFFNCCPQIAFHQHHHHIVPAGHGSKDSPMYPGLPFLSSMAYFGFGNGLSFAPLSQNPNGETKIEAGTTSAPISPQSIPSENGKQPLLQPPDGNPTTLPENNSAKPIIPELHTYPYFVPNRDWSYLPQNGKWQNLPQSQSPIRVNDPVNPEVQYEPYNVRPLKQQNGPLSSYVAQYPQQQPTQYLNRPTAKELQPSDTKSSEYKWPAYPKAQSEFNPHLVPYYMLQDAQEPTYNKSMSPNNPLQPQPSVSDSKKSPKYEQTAHSYSEPKSYVLLQHGPPSREPNSAAKSIQSFRKLVRDPNLRGHPQDLSLPQGKLQHPKWLNKRMTSHLPSNVNYMPRPGDRSGLPFFTASDRAHLAPVPQDSFSAVQIKPKFLESFKKFLKPVVPRGSRRRIPPHVPGKAFQQWSSAAGQQANGLNQPIERGGNQMQK
ncbi:hypothetical protein PAMP_004593 [Pampus punctatissimus]